MRKLSNSAFAIVLLATLASGPVWAKSGWDFKLNHTREINGIQLEPGSYQLRLNGNHEAEIFRNRKLITTAAVELRPLGNGTPARSIMTKGGVIVEIRMKKEVVVFHDGSVGS